MVDHGLREKRRKPIVVKIKFEAWDRHKNHVEESLDREFGKAKHPRYNPLTSEGGW
jgi:hypothetical protein